MARVCRRCMLCNPMASELQAMMQQRLDPEVHQDVTSQDWLTIDG
jgi:hypothetical protein